MAKSSISKVCSSCNCDGKEARKYIEYEIDNLCELIDLGDLRYNDIEVSCDNLGLDYDEVEYFLQVLAS